MKLLSLIGKSGRDIYVLRKVDDINWVNSKEVKADFLDVKQNEEVVLIVKLPKKADLTVSVYANCTANFKVEALSDEEEMKYLEGIAFFMKINETHQMVLSYGQFGPEKYYFTALRMFLQAKTQLNLFLNSQSILTLYPRQTYKANTL